MPESAPTKPALLIWEDLLLMGSLSQVEERIRWLTDRYSKPDIEYYSNPVIVDNVSGDIIA